MKLKHVTFTGADDKTDLLEIQKISDQYPFVEWGFLLSKSKNGLQRYPSLETFKKILPLNIKKSIHICGQICYSIVGNGWIEDEESIELFQIASHMADRFQLNFNVKSTPIDLIGIFWFSRFFPEFILQQNKSNEHFINAITPYVHKTKRVHVLFDCSGGRGTVINEIPKPIDNIFCGYAGGLNPENLEQKLEEINSVVADKEIWIDMESGVRINNEFDLKKVVQCCEIAKKYI